MDLDTLLSRRKNFKQSKNYNIMYSEKELNFILEKIIILNKKLSMTKICKKYRISRKVLRRLLLEKKKYSPVNRQNLLRVREDLFLQIRTEEDAYWLGFIYADGYISSSGKFELSLKHSDYQHLLKFAIYCGFDIDKVVKCQPVGEYFRCRISFATQHLQKRFTKLGVVPQKSLRLTFPTFLKEKLIPHFIRGYFDGDGNIYYRNIYKRSSTVLGTKEFLTVLKNIVPIKNNGTIRRINNIYVFTFNSLGSDKFLNYLYKNCTIFLERKYKNYKSYQLSIAPLYSNV